MCPSHFSEIRSSSVLIRTWLIIVVLVLGLVLSGCDNLTSSDDANPTGSDNGSDQDEVGGVITLTGVIAFNTDLYSDMFDIYEQQIMFYSFEDKTMTWLVTAGKTLSPAWSPDGCRIAYYIDSGSFPDRYQIWTMRDDGTNETRLTTTGGNADPAWSPDGTQIAFTSDRPDGKWEVWKMNSNGSGQVQLTTSEWNRSPSWSSNGSRIAYVSGWVATSVWAMNADGGGKTMLADDGDNPAWSPDGSRIAFERFTDRAHVWIMNADGTGERQLTGEFGGNEPSWSPDGNWITYTRGRNIWYMTADGNDHTQLTNEDAAGICMRPTWGLR